MILLSLIPDKTLFRHKTTERFYTPIYVKVNRLKLRWPWQLNILQTKKTHTNTQTLKIRKTIWQRCFQGTLNSDESGCMGHVQCPTVTFEVKTNKMKVTSVSLREKEDYSFTAVTLHWALRATILICFFSDPVSWSTKHHHWDDIWYYANKPRLITVNESSPQGFRKFSGWHKNSQLPTSDEHVL